MAQDVGVNSFYPENGNERSADQLNTILDPEIIEKHTQIKQK